ncbi:outer membrane beta-barrel family protein [Mucilaginibacter sabulilitoris]|uniref:Outer membrane beta-barrel family protein n=1 Tax=Mucilaginibacter sabulilitoris TaxID=1173583 RepID=A0ABZ0TQR8_9SPHI|nr:outer membrane beta-barrel family protein [Mucilaginibacter sabulilitoris]WPU93830.1 outer membrane beta-barrel family protein [Mucilaginibacter sabulilitoris]
MKITFLAVIILCLSTVSVFAQNNYSVKGSVADTASNSQLTNTTIMVLAAKDSILQKFTRVNNGTFSVNNLKKGKFILLATYPGYADYVERFTLDSAHTSHDFGHIKMILKSQLLAEVIVKAKVAAVKIKGDTTEFNAAAFTVQPNAKVEDLLKELPGIQVDKDGKITAQGQTVNKVLVDGEEFFGDDPTLVTKNLRADMVDKVQLYDKKSDQASFTGIDDGVKDKTINIKLKEDKKNGYFGKADAEGGTDKYYQEQLMFNRFKGKQKFSAYGTIGNTGKTGLGWQDNSKYGSAGNMEFSDDGGVYFYGGGGDDGLDSFNGQYNGQGIPLARSGGLHYDTKWNSDKESINTNYKIGSLNVDGTRNTQTQNNLPQTFFNSNSDQNFHNHIFRQKLDATYQLKPDTSSNLKISIDGTTKSTIADNDYNTTSLRADSTMLNSNKRSITNSGTQKILNASLFYNKKFRKKGRSFSVSINEAYNENENKGFLNSEIDYFNTAGQLDSMQKIDQYKTGLSKSSILNTNITYSEPFTKSFAVVLNYGLNINNGRSDRRSFNKSATGQYDDLDESLSNNFKLNQLSNQFGAVFNYKKNKTIINFGSKVSNVNFKQIDEFTNNTLTRNFVNWYPQASFQYKFSQQRSFSVYYNGNTSQPSIDQIQPVRVNTDPLNITLGNPDLRPSFTNRISAYYNSYKVISGQSIWFGGSYSRTINPIVNNVTTDSTGASTYQSSNLKGHQTSNMNFNGSFNQKIPNVDINAGIGASMNGSNYFNLTNNQLNETKSFTYGASLRFSKYKQKKYDFWTGAGPTYTINSSSLQKNINNNGRGFNAYGGFNLYLPAKFQIGSDANYQYNAATQSFNQDFRRTTLNASITKSFMKDESLKLSISGNDLLNQNTGYSRTGSANILTQERYTTIKRYFMLSLVWDFNHMGGGAPKK